MRFAPVILAAGCAMAVMGCAHEARPMGKLAYAGIYRELEPEDTAHMDRAIADGTSTTIIHVNAHDRRRSWSTPKDMPLDLDGRIPIAIDRVDFWRRTGVWLPETMPLVYKDRAEQEAARNLEAVLVAVEVVSRQLEGHPDPEDLKRIGALAADATAALDAILEQDDKRVPASYTQSHAVRMEHMRNAADEAVAAVDALLNGGALRLIDMTAQDEPHRLGGIAKMDALRAVIGRLTRDSTALAAVAAAGDAPKSVARAARFRLAVLALYTNSAWYALERGMADLAWREQPDATIMAEQRLLMDRLRRAADAAWIAAEPLSWIPQDQPVPVIIYE